MSAFNKYILDEKYIDEFIDMYKKEGDIGRFHAYDWVHNKFEKTILGIEPINYDDLALHLYAFLGNWGMLRGSGFLLYLNYKSLVPIVEIVLEAKYKWLLNIDIDKLIANKEKFIDAVLELAERIRNVFKGKKCYKFDLDKSAYNDKDINVSDTFIGKVLLSTFGCYISCDEYTKKSLKECGISQNISKKQAGELVELIKLNGTMLSKYVSKMTPPATFANYPVMKILDMLLWQEGLYL